MAESTLERKLIGDEELSLAEIVKMLKEVKVNGEIQQATLETLARAIAEIVGDLAVLKAEKEDEHIRVDFGALGDSYACFARCFEFLFRGIGNVSRDIGAQMWRSWSQWDVVLKIIMSLMVFHVLSSIQSACRNSFRLVSKGWKTARGMGGLISGVVGWSRRIPVKDDIDAYKQLIAVSRYPGESQAEFIDKLVNKWKAMSSRLSDGRLLEILQQHFPPRVPQYYLRAGLKQGGSGGSITQMEQLREDSQAQGCQPGDGPRSRIKRTSTPSPSPKTESSTGREERWTSRKMHQV